MFQDFWGGGEEAQVVFCQHERDNLNPADCFHLLCDLSTPCHLHREEEENHLLGRDGTRRSSSAVHLQEGSWRRICATRRGELDGGREEGGKVPPLLDHHNINLHIYLFHNHIQHLKYCMHTSWCKLLPWEIDLILPILPCCICLTDMFLLPFSFHPCNSFNLTNMCKLNKSAKLFCFCEKLCEVGIYYCAATVLIQTQNTNTQIINHVLCKFRSKNEEN